MPVLGLEDEINETYFLSKWRFFVIALKNITTIPILQMKTHVFGTL